MRPLLSLLLAFASSSAIALDLESIFLESTHDGPELPSIEWIEGGDAYVERVDDEEARTATWWRVDSASGERAIWLVLEDWEEVEGDGHEVSDISISPDESQVLVRCDEDVRWRHSRSYAHWLIDRASGRRVPLGDEARQLHAQWSPDGRRIGYVSGGDLYVFDVDSEDTQRLTEDGGESVFNGDPDWVYEEELGMVAAWWWSSESTHVAYLHTEAGAIGHFPLVTQGDGAYPKLQMLPYPKAGSSNSTVTLRVAELASGESRDLRTLGPDDGYFARVHFAPDAARMIYQWIDRDQNRHELRAVELESGQQRLLYAEDSHGWIDIDDMVHALPGGDLLLSSERDGWRHLYRLNGASGQLTQLTRGEWELRDLVHLDDEAGEALIATTRGSHLGQAIDRLSLRDGALEALLGAESWNEVDVAPNGRYMVHTERRADRRPQMRLLDGSADEVRSLVTDEMEDLADSPMPEYRFESFVTEDGLQLFSSMILPPDFDASRRYPVVVYCYGGPDSQVVRRTWISRGRSLYHRLLAQEGFIVFMVDGRGSGGRGREFRHSVYRKLGQLEAEDQLAGVRYLKSLPYVDPDRIAIWGWSYGGYLSAMTLLKGSGEVRAAIAVAPVSDWRFYDTLYTERYMGTPDDNPEGYDDGSLLREVDQLQGRLLLIHGSADDNVHPQNTLRLVTALQEAGKDFELMIYPDKAHAIDGKKTRYHLYRTMGDFLYRSLDIPTTEEELR